MSMFYIAISPTQVIHTPTLRLLCLASMILHFVVQEAMCPLSNHYVGVSKSFCNSSFLTADINIILMVG